MTPDAFSALKNFFLMIWNLLGSFTFPGTSLTGQHMLVAPLGAIVFITALKKILDIGGAAASTGWTIISNRGRNNGPHKSNNGKEE